MRLVAFSFTVALAACHTAPEPSPPPGPPPGPVYHVKATKNFKVTGKGDNAAWKKADWAPLQKRQSDGHPYESRFKMLYSKKGVYILMDGTDRKLTTTMTDPFSHLWKEDVYEVFLWPDERHTFYFEYEISPTNHELPIMVPNVDGKFFGWTPWDYKGRRKIEKATSATGGPVESGAKVTGWRAEFFIPCKLLRPLGNVPPKPGMRWRANFYRVDHDDGTRTHWEWARVDNRFHEFQKFGTLVFE